MHYWILLGSTVAVFWGTICHDGMPFYGEHCLHSSSSGLQVLPGCYIYRLDITLQWMILSVDVRLCSTIFGTRLGVLELCLLVLPQTLLTGDHMFMAREGVGTQHVRLG